MSRDVIIRMAKEVWGDTTVLPFEELEHFAALVAAYEREKCATICDRQASTNDGFMTAMWEVSEKIRKAK